MTEEEGEKLLRRVEKAEALVKRAREILLDISRFVSCGRVRQGAPASCRQSQPGTPWNWCATCHARYGLDELSRLEKEEG